MMEKIKRKSIARQHIIRTLIGLLVTTVVFAISAWTDAENAKFSMERTAVYIKEQCNRYSRIQLASETKSLMRVLESCKHVAHEMSGLSEQRKNLDEYADANYLSGLILLDSEGNVLSRSQEPGEHFELLAEYLHSDALLDVAKNPAKRYAVRISCEDGGEMDVGALSRWDQEGILVGYYHTPADYENAFSLTISSLLDGFEMENGGTVAVCEEGRVVASNNPALMGKTTEEVPILHEIQSNYHSKGLVTARQSENAYSRYFGLMERGRTAYVFAFMPERDIYIDAPRMTVYAMVIYLVILSALSYVRMQTAQRYREEQMKVQRQYAQRLQDKNEQLSTAVEAADQANAAKTSFLSRMSHDMRTPLNGIIGLLEIDAAHPENTALVNANRDKMRIAADHLLSLINDVLQMSKLESGEIILANEPVDLNHLATEVMTIVSQRAAESGVTLIYDETSDAVDPNWVYGSPLHLRQIFLNIYTNCIKYNRVGGSISTRFRVISEDESRVTYCWTISDTGIGMTAEFLNHIFDPFTQANADARSVYQGTGLGMTIVKGLVEKMQGTIQVHSEKDVGSTFTITIPFELAQPAQAKEPVPAVQTRASIDGMHLLLAEDNELNAEIAQILLGDAGARITLVGNGQEAVAAFRDGAPGTYDAILMDIMMPVMDGLTAAREIRALDRPDAKTIPIIAMTANAFQEDADQCLAAGMNAHLMKPLDMEKVIATISEEVGKN